MDTSQLQLKQRLSFIFIWCGIRINALRRRKCCINVSSAIKSNNIKWVSLNPNYSKLIQLLFWKFQPSSGKTAIIAQIELKMCLIVLSVPSYFVCTVFSCRANLCCARRILKFPLESVELDSVSTDSATTCHNWKKFPSPWRAAHLSSVKWKLSVDRWHGTKAKCISRRAQNCPRNVLKVCLKSN